MGNLRICLSQRRFHQPHLRHAEPPLQHAEYLWERSRPRLRYSRNQISSYAYTLGPAGNRLSVAELRGRTVTYGYDDLYWLTSETVAGDPNGNNRAVS